MGKRLKTRALVDLLYYGTGSIALTPNSPTKKKGESDNFFRQFDRGAIAINSSRMRLIFTKIITVDLRAFFLSLSRRRAKRVTRYRYMGGTH